jgi:hypothetical protein
MIHIYRSRLPAFYLVIELRRKLVVRSPVSKCRYSSKEFVPRLKYDASAAMATLAPTWFCRSLL